MIQKITKCIGVVLLVAAPYLSFGQYLNMLYDYDSTYDWGCDVFVNPDNTFFIIASSQSAYNDIWTSTNMTISSDGNTILNKNEYGYYTSSVYNGDPGTVKKLVTGEYLSAMTINTPNIDYNNSAAGFMKLNAVGDTTFFKTYTDTSRFYEYFFDCTVTANGKYLGGGGHSFNGVNDPSTVLGYIICTDSIGDTLWTHTYQKDTGQYVYVDRMIPLADGRIVVAAQSTAIIFYAPSTDNLILNAPWFMVLDSMGNILKDTLYDYHSYIGTTTLTGGNNIYQDANGGYFYYGCKYSIPVTAYPDDYANFPYYFARLDTNFRTVWTLDLPYSDAFADTFGKRYIYKCIQLPDGSYILAGAMGKDGYEYEFGWAAKVSAEGSLLWNQYYVSDSAQTIAQFRDVIAKPNGNIVFIGCTASDTLPAWRTNEDIWLVETDSNGCLVPGCGNGLSTAVPAAPAISSGAVKIYPNPTSGSITISTSGSGKFRIYTMMGQQLHEYIVSSGSTSMQLPNGMAPGLYMGEFIPDSGGTKQEVRLVYQP